MIDDQDEDCDEPINLTEIQPHIFKLAIEFVEHQSKEPLPEIEKPLKHDLNEVIPEWYWNFINMEDQ